jgi:hypothetical protein
VTTALARPTVDGKPSCGALVDIDDHLERLGLQTRTQYRLWCHRHGLSTSLEKLADEAHGELGLLGVALQPSVRHHTASRRRLIEQIDAGEFDARLHKLPETRAVIRRRGR